MSKINRTSQVALNREATVTDQPATAELHTAPMPADPAVAGVV